ncbi:cupin fold metalloprotein, WbuC family, partial [Escherichia coli]
MPGKYQNRTTGQHKGIRANPSTGQSDPVFESILLDTGGIIFEVKHGGYQPVAADDYAHWAPAEGEPGTTELMAWY